MQASTRIGIAGCVLVAGAVTAGMFRKAPDESVLGDRSDGGLVLRQPDQAPLLAADTPADGWRGRVAEAPPAPKEQRKAPGGELAAANPATPPLPRLTTPDHVTDALRDSHPRLAETRPHATDVDDDWQLHEVADGDTLPALAERYFGDAALADAIRRANAAALKNSDILPIGVFLKIPSRRAIEAAGAVQPQMRENSGPSPAGSEWRKAASRRP